MSNPFDVIDARLSNIENLLLDIKHKPKETVDTHETETLLTVDEAAKFMHLSVPTIYTKISKGELPVIKNPGSKRCYFSKSDLFDYLKTGRKKTVRELDNEAEKYFLSKKAVASF